MTFHDGWFDHFIPEIRAGGLIPGAYHFLRASSGAEQARVFHSRVAAHGGPQGFLCALDNESDADWNTTVGFVNEWNRLTGSHPLLMYTGGWWWRPRGWNGMSLTPYLWHSQYVDGSGYGSALYQRVPESWWSPGYGGWEQATILQFSSKGWVAGQNVDVNAFRGSLGDLLTLTRGTGIPSPGPNPTPTIPDGDWNLGMSFDDFKNGSIGAPPPDWMGGPRDRMRMGDWYGTLPGKLTEIHQAANGASATANTARDEAAAARAAAAEARDLAKQALDAISKLSLAGIAPATLAVAPAPHLPSAAATRSYHTPRMTITARCR